MKRHSRFMARKEEACETSRVGGCKDIIFSGLRYLKRSVLDLPTVCYLGEGGQQKRQVHPELAAYPPRTREDCRPRPLSLCSCLSLFQDTCESSQAPSNFSPSFSSGGPHYPSIVTRVSEGRVATRFYGLAFLSASCFPRVSFRGMV